jgi:hypothetical protein
MTELIRYDAMCRAIDAAYEVDEVKAIHDQAAMLQAAARVAHNVDAETRAYEIRMRAARKAGELSKKIEKASAARGNQYKEANPHNAEQAKGKVLEKAGISTQQASDWESVSPPSHETSSRPRARAVRVRALSESRNFKPGGF